MMNSSHLFLCCLLAFSLYFFPQYTSGSVKIIPTTMQKRTMSVPVPVPEHEYHRIKVADKAMESALAKEDSMTQEYTSNINTPHDVVYHIDYHGVTTHPTPKHPKP